MKQVLIALMVLVTARGFGEEEMLPRPPRPPGSASELSRLIAETRIGEGQSYRNLVVYPLFTSNRARRGYWTLNQALAKELIRISEKGVGSVPELLVENQSDEPVFLLAGEIVTGGKQNRVVSQDILLAPHSGPIGLGVFCVEQGRWTQRTQYFGAEKELAHGKLRQQLNAPAVSQSVVWNEVARKADAVAAAVPNETRYLGKIYESGQVRRDLDDYTKAIVWSEDANGMAVMIGGRVVGVELFCDSETFARLRDKLLRSYAVDAIEFSGIVKPMPGRDVVEQFLQNAQRAQLTPKETIGIGRLFAVNGGGIYGSVLFWHAQTGAHGVVHAGLFAAPGVEQPPVIVPFAPRPLPRW
jgi:hypothetical protein